MRITCWMKSTNTHSQHMLLLHYNSGYKNAPHCYVIRTLPALLHFFPMSPTSRGELTSLHRLELSGFGATDDQVLLHKPTENPIEQAVVLCSWTLRYFPAQTSISVAGCARCVCQTADRVYTMSGLHDIRAVHCNITHSSNNSFEKFDTATRKFTSQIYSFCS